MAGSHYDTLAVSKMATEKDIKKAFGKLAKIYHPDVAKDEGDKEKFQRIVKAYEVLSNADKRKEYDLETQRKTEDDGTGPQRSGRD